MTMAMNKKNKKNEDNYQEDIIRGSRPWPCLPRQLINILERKPVLMQNISYGGIAKSWMTSTRHCCNSSTLMFLQLNIIASNNNRIPYIFDVSRRGKYKYIERWVRRSSYNPSRYFVGCSHGWVFTKLANISSSCELWDPFEKKFADIPRWKHNFPFKLATLCQRSSSTIMVLTGMTHPAFAFYRKTLRLRENVWTLKDCNLADPNGNSTAKQLMQFTNAIGFEGKFYALSLQGTVVVLEEINGSFEITRVSTKRAVPSVVLSYKHFKEYLVESRGEILLVFLIFVKSSNVVDDVEVFQLCFSNLSWIKKEGLGDRTLFVGEDCCMWINASEVGSRKNCIYFSHGKDEGSWWIFGMKTCKISPADSGCHIINLE